MHAGNGDSEPGPEPALLLSLRSHCVPPLSPDQRRRGRFPSNRSRGQRSTNRVGRKDSPTGVLDVIAFRGVRVRPGDV